jgi:hypothetical protein
MVISKKYRFMRYSMNNHLVMKESGWRMQCVNLELLFLWF